MLKKITALLLTLVVTTVYAQTPQQVVNDTMQKYLAAQGIPGAAVILYVDGKPEAFYYGVANLETKQPVSSQTIFELGSITKLMTTLLVAQEVDFAKIKLKEPITKYVPTLPASFSGMTVRQLATHTAGVPFYPPETVKNRADFEKYAVTYQPNQASDKVYIYSNMSIGLLGYALEAITHQNYNQLYRTKILAPLGMQPIALNVPEKLKAFYAQGYDKDGKPAQRVNETEETDLFPAAGGMKASAGDMGKFLGAAMTLPGTPSSISYPMLMTETAYVEMNGVEQGLGWQIHEINSKEKINTLLAASDYIGLDTAPVTEVFAEPVYNGDELIDKTGATSGFRSYIAVIPNKKTGIVILANKKIEGNSLMMVAREILFKVNNLI